MSSYLWIIDLPFAARFHNGGLVRYFNFSRELVAMGHRVTFALVMEDEHERALEWMRSQREQGVCTDYCVLSAEGSAWNRAAMLLLPFSLENLAIGDFRRNAAVAIGELVRRYSADVLVVSSVRFLYTAWEVRLCPTIGDFCDAVTLYWWRDIRLQLSRGNYVRAMKQAPNLVVQYLRERRVCRKYDANIIVSPVDKKLFDRMAGSGAKNRLIGNGVRFHANAGSVAKIANRMIFTGAMDFAPNYDSAHWFLEHVFPKVLEEIPEAVFVIAGARPDASLLARAGANVKVTGFVDDLGKAIAESALYVAPMRSGSGFKNKVAEAIANGTWLVGTEMAVEFLEPRLRDLIPVRDEPAALARLICEFLRDPAACEARLREVRRIVAEEFSWTAQAGALHAVVESLRRQES